MNVIRFNDKACEKIRGYFDSYLDNELLVETNHEVLRHLAACADCVRILEGRTRLKKAVRQAVSNEHVPDGLVESVQRTIRTKQPSFLAGDVGRWVLATAAVLIFAAGSFVAMRTGIWSRPGSTDVLGLISAQARQILAVGLIDHIHCTLKLGRWKELLSFEQMKEATGETALGTEFIGLVPLVTEKAGPNFQIVQGHRCIIDEREYVHLILTGREDAILSLVITEKKGEAFTRAEVAATVQASGVPVYRDNQENLEIAGFETERFLAFVVSNLGREANLKVASELAPSVHDYLRRIGG